MIKKRGRSRTIRCQVYIMPALSVTIQNHDKNWIEV